jgi:hypothetical protein
VSSKLFAPVEISAQLSQARDVIDTDPAPESDLCRALADALKLWNSPADRAGDERNVVLTLARIRCSAANGKIVPKDVAADCAMGRLPAEHRPVDEVRSFHETRSRQIVDHPRFFWKAPSWMSESPCSRYRS